MRRKEDIQPLIDMYARKFSDFHGKPISSITDEVVQLMESYTWPDNIRDLPTALKAQWL